MEKRVFTAFPVPSAVQEYLGELARGMAENLSPEEVVRWVRPEGIHITAHFLGDRDEAELAIIREICAATAGDFRAATVKLGAIVTFPLREDPRVVTVSLIEDETFVLRKLQAQLGRAFERAGIDVDHRLWAPHVTLGRVKTRLRRNFAGLPVKSLDFKITELQFLESERTEDGALYSPLAAFPLGLGM